ncbi:MAG: hypothetical protein HY320_14645 [Armatimonadetes bacterium]|nr:hypothetical protein [Armatimonadota bacterium]
MALDVEAYPHRPVDDLKAAIALFGLLDGCEQFLLYFNETFLDEENDLEYRESFNLLDTYIASQGGWIWFHAGELLNEFLVCRTASPYSRRHLLSELRAAPPAASMDVPAGAELDMPWLDRQDTLKDRIVDLLPRILGLDPSDAIEACAGALARVCYVIPRTVLALKKLADDACESQEMTPEVIDRRIAHLDSVILMLSSLIASLCLFASSNEQLWTIYNRTHYPE